MYARTAEDQLPFSSREDFYKEFDDLRKRFDETEPVLEVTVSDPEQGVEGYIVVWNTDISQGGPLEACGKGGTRITKDLELNDIRRLARSMAEKNATAGLPLGGAKSGLKADPTAPDYEQKYRRFVELCKPYLFENGGVFGGFGYDVGGIPPKNAIWACETLGSSRSFTGKPVEMGGTDYDREGIAGLGVATAAQALLKQKAKNVEGALFAVQGLGAMGAAVLRYFTAYGGVLYALADPKYGGTWVFKDGISQKLLDALVAQDDDVAQKYLSSEGNHISDNSQEVLYQPVDILFPCAIEDVITSENVGKIVAPFICEGANNPTTAEGYQALFESGKIVIPDIIANVGGIIAAFIELTSTVTVEENTRTRKKVQEAKDMTIKKITKNVHNLMKFVDGLGVEPSLAGRYIAYRNIFYGIAEH